MQKADRFPQTGLLLAAGGLVMVCQLVSMAMVADQQVHSAGVRDLQRVAQQLALADCMAHSAGAARHGCIRQSQLEPEGYEFAFAGAVNGRPAKLRNAAVGGDAGVKDAAVMMRVGVTPDR